MGQALPGIEDIRLCLGGKVVAGTARIGAPPPP